MSSVVSIPIAFVAGLLSFASPCVLPLIPSWLSFIGGVGYADLGSDGATRRRLFLRTVAFVIGFSIVFVALGVLFSGPALLFSSVGQWINLVAGWIVILLGLNTIFDITFQRERRVQVQRRPTTFLSAIVVGMAFGAGWSPCIGPILASILLMAGTQGEIGRAVALLIVYSLGLGLPFLLAGAWFSQAQSLLGRIRRHMGTIRAASGVFLIVIGILIALGRFQQINGLLASAGYGLQSWSTAHGPTADRIIAAILACVAATAPIARRITGRKTFTVANGAVGIVLLAAALLSAFGLVDVPSIVAGWLLYQGI